MKNRDLIPAWGRILQGQRPFLSIEITKECPLQCPGCYAYGLEHLGGASTLRELRDAKGDALVAGVLGLVRRFRPLHVSIVGGEPLVRYRELDVLLPKLQDMGVEVMVVTSAVRPIPKSWHDLPNLCLSASIDGLQPEHDRRRAPATYDRILKHIAGHRINVHCTITRQLIQRPDYLQEFASFWSERQEVRKIWFSLYRPQEGEVSEERLAPQDRTKVLEELFRLRRLFPPIDLPDMVLKGRRLRPTSACLRRRPRVFSPTLRPSSLPASLVAVRYARSAAASPPPGSPRWPNTSWQAWCRLARFLPFPRNSVTGWLPPPPELLIAPRCAQYEPLSFLELRKIVERVI
jgi:organic radical activating enzyme